MKTFRNLKGVIMFKDSPLVNFCIQRGEIIACDVLTKDNLPLEFCAALSKYEALMVFLDDRVVPSTRLFIDRDLKRVGIPYYDPDLILKYNNGFAIDDDYWVRFDDGDQTYEELMNRLYYKKSGQC